MGCMALDIQWLPIVGQHRLDVGGAKHRVNRLLEGTKVFLPEPALAHRPSLLLQEAWHNARAVRRRDRDAVPCFGSFPFMEEPTALAEWRRQSDQPPLADRQHR